MALATYTVNGTRLTVDMKAPLAEAQRLIDADPLTRGIKLTPIRGYGSYSDNRSSADVDAGSGHVDFNAEPMTDAQAQRCVMYLRRVGFLAYFRPRSWWSSWLGRLRKPGWQRHIHCLLVGSADLSPAAKAQIREWVAGGDALVGPEVDNGDRTVVGRTWSAYLAIRDAVVNVGKVVVSAAKGKTSTANIAVTLDKPIRMASLRQGPTKSTDVSRYQAALWNRLPSAVRQEFIDRYGLKRTDLYDGVYGKVTAAMTSRLYVLIRLPAATEPGPKMMRHLGFTDVRK
ncbi:MAG TPA: hypothetical protein VGF17_24480 [Phytomonospora sp.]